MVDFVGRAWYTGGARYRSFLRWRGWTGAGTRIYILPGGDEHFVKELSARKNIRLNGFDYSNAGYYFITICVRDRHEMLWDGKPVGAHIVRPPLSDIGNVVEVAIDNISKIYNHIRIDKYVIMPNHIHMILCIDNPARDGGRTMCAPTSVSRVIRHCKEYVTKQIGFSMWQKSFNDRIIRDEAEYQRIWQYIEVV